MKTLPPGVNRRTCTFDQTLGEFRAAIGPDWVFSDDESVALYRDPYSPLQGKPEERVASAAVAPASAEEVQAIVRIANRHRIPLYPNLHRQEPVWRYGGSLIGDEGSRREAFNIMLSMPRGTAPLIVQRAARGFAQTELADHKYVMVLHDHQANPHVHISVRAESHYGRRLNPRKADL